MTILRKAQILLLLGGIFLGTLGISKAPASPNALSAAVPIPPLGFLARRLGGENLTVHTLLPPGRDPHTYTPLPGQIRELGETSCFFYLGLPLEKDLLKASGEDPSFKVVPLLEGISLHSMEDHHHPGKIHPEKEHPEKFPNLEGYDPHVWMDPQNMILMTRTMGAALRKLDPEHAGQYEAREKQLLEELQVLHGYLQHMLEPLKGATLMVYHPAYGYFCRAYGLHQEAVEREGKPPRGKDLTNLIKKAEQESLRAIFIQPQFDQRAARTIAQTLHARVLPFDPFPEDYIAYLQSMGAILRTQLVPPGEKGTP